MTDDMSSDTLASMYAEVVRGVPVGKSRFAVSDENRSVYAQIVAEVAAARAANPSVQFDIPNEIPGAFT